MDNNSTNIIALLTVIVVIIALVNFSVTIIKIASFNEAMTGYASGTGYVNITVTQNIAINVSRYAIDWGSGTINTTAGCQNGTMWTRGDADPVVQCANFTQTGGPKGIVIQNLGSVNFSLNLSGVQNGTDFFGGTNPTYRWNVSNRDSGTCNTANNGTSINQSVWFNVEKGISYNACKQFGYLTNNEMFLDVYIRIPSDNNVTDNIQRRDIITLTAYTAI